MGGGLDRQAEIGSHNADADVGAMLETLPGVYLRSHINRSAMAGTLLSQVILKVGVAELVERAVLA
jgi:hypothetical protein